MGNNQQNNQQEEQWKPIFTAGGNNTVTLSSSADEISTVYGGDGADTVNAKTITVNRFPHRNSFGH